MHGWFSRRGGSGCLGHMQWSSGGALPLKTCGQGGTVPAAGTGCACRALHTFVGRSRVFDSSWPAGICLPGARLPGRVSSADGDGRSHACGPSGDCVLGTHPFNRTLFPGNNGCAARFAPTALPGLSAEGGARHSLKVQLRCNGARRRGLPHRRTAEPSPGSSARKRGLARLTLIPHLRCRNPTSITPGRRAYAFGGSSFWLNTRSITSSSSSSENGLVM